MRLTYFKYIFVAFLLSLSGLIHKAVAADSNYLYSGALTSIEDAPLSGSSYNIASGISSGYSNTTSTLVEYDVTTSATGYGTIFYPPFVEHGLTGSCIITPADAFTVVTISGCGGIWSGTSPYVTGAITAPCSVTASFTDNTPPATTTTPTTGTYAASQSVTLACTDQGGSGCAATRYCLGSGCTPATLYTGPITIDTTTVLRFSSSDNAGNNEAVQEASYTIIPYYNLAVTTSGNGSVNSSPAGDIVCPGGACSKSYQNGATVTLIATAGGDSYLSTLNGWSGCDSVTGAVCTVTMSAAKNVITTFTLLTSGSNYSFDGSFSSIADVPMSGTNYDIIDAVMTGMGTTTSTLVKYTIFTQITGFGALSCTPFVEHGLTGSCLVAPAANYTLASVGGCGGTWNGLVYLTGPVTAPCTVAAVFAAIDSTPPVTMVSPVAGTYSTTQNATLSCLDTGGSGCSATYYCLGSGCSPVTLYTGSISITSDQVLRFRSIDNAGNPEAVLEASYTITSATGGGEVAVPGMSLLLILVLTLSMSGYLFWNDRKRKVN